MFDLNALKDSADLLAISERDTVLKKVASSGGGEWAGPCPFCGGRDRFRVQPHEKRWLCRYCTAGKWKDVIEYIARRDHLNPKQFFDLKEICIRATGSCYYSSNNVIPIVQFTAAPKAPPNPQWQAQAREFIKSSEDALWSDFGTEGCKYLAQRGLNEETIRSCRLGFNPQPIRLSSLDWGINDPSGYVYIPSGIIIPCIIQGDIWYIKIRQLNGKSPKYLTVKGSVPALFGADNLSDADMVLLTEGEFDAILAGQQLGDIVSVGTLGSASQSFDALTWEKYFQKVRIVFTCYDTDVAGNAGVSRLNGIPAPVFDLTIPTLRPGDKDITDFYLSGGDLHSWFIDSLNYEDET